MDGLEVEPFEERDEGKLARVDVGDARNVCEFRHRLAHEALLERRGTRLYLHTCGERRRVSRLFRADDACVSIVPRPLVRPRSTSFFSILMFDSDSRFDI